ncbi:MAG: hypothetical protein ACRCUA_01655 [Fusobacteriaceae bacterium]
MKKIILIIMLIGMSTLSFSSWWGNRSTGSRAAMIAGGLILLNDTEIGHANRMYRADRDIRRGYEMDRVVQNAHNKYGNNMNQNYRNSNYNDGYNQNYTRNTRATHRIVYEDARTQIVEMGDGKRLVINKNSK